MARRLRFEYAGGLYHVINRGNYRAWLFECRPECLRFEACLESAGALPDSSRGRVKYLEYLRWLSEDEPTRKAMLFERMSRGEGVQAVAAEGR